MDYKTLFSQTPPTRLFFKAAIPGSIGMLASALYQVADGIFISRILGDTAFAGFNLAMPLVIINFALADLIGLGSAVPISIKLGSKDEQEANNYFTCASIMVVLAGILSGAVLALGGRTFLSWMGAQGELLDQATQYLVTYALCSPVTTIVFAVDNYLRICGKIRRSMFLNIFMSVACMGFELLFMGVLKIGIRGAALGSSLGMALTAIAAFVPFFFGKMQLRFVRPRFHAKALREIVSCGLPSFLNNIAGRVTSIIMNVVLLALGGQNAVSVYGILMTMDGFVHPLLYGMCDSLQPAVGFNWGARNIQRVKAIEKRCYTAAINGVFAFLTAGALVLTRNGVTSQFLLNLIFYIIITPVIALTLTRIMFQSENTGLVDGVGTEEEILAEIRTLIGMLPCNNEEDVSYEECTDDLNRLCENMEGAAADGAVALSQISDGGVFFETKKAFARDMVTGFIRLNGSAPVALTAPGQLTAGAMHTINVLVKAPLITGPGYTIDPDLHTITLESGATLNQEMVDTALGGTGTLVINGLLSAGDCALVNSNYGQTITHLTLNDMTSIEDNSFNRLEALQSVTLPKATQVGKGAFWNIFLLREVSLTAAGTIYISPDSFYSGTITLTLNADKRGEVSHDDQQGYDLWQGIPWKEIIFQE